MGKNILLLLWFLSFIGGSDALWLATCSRSGFIWWSREMGPISLPSTFPSLCPLGVPCHTACSTQPVCAQLLCKKMLDCSSVGAPGLRGSQAGREHRQGKCRQEAKWPCGLTGAACSCPARSEWQQCPWPACWHKGTASPALCQQPSVSASRRGGGKKFNFTLVYIGLGFFPT